MNLLLRKNPKGETPLKTLPFREDPETGFLVRLFGYCQNCQEPICIKSVDYRQILEDCFGVPIPVDKKPLRVKIAEFLMKNHRLDTKLQ